MLVNTIEFSPVPRFGITRAPRKSYEYESWWKEERLRCMEGFTVGGTHITGRHYWYLNYWKIRGINKLLYPDQRLKKLVAPRFLELDYDFFNEIEKAQLSNENMFIGKKRQCGFTFKISSMAGYELSFFPASQTVIVAGEEKYAKKTMGDTMRGLNGVYGTAFYKRKNPNTFAEIIARYKASNEYGEEYWKGFMSEIYMLTAKDNPEVVSRFSPSLIIFEETGKFKNLIRTYRFVEPSLWTENGIKTGFAIFLGTGGEMEEGIKDCSTIMFNPSDFDCRQYENIYSDAPDKKMICYFVPGYRYDIIDNDGNDMVEESMADMDNERAKAAASSDQDALLKEVIARPKNPEEMYAITKDSYFDNLKLNRQRVNILTRKGLSYLSVMGDLEWIYDGVSKKRNPYGNIIGIEWKPGEGPVLVIEPPKMDSLGKPKPGCFGGTDSIDKDEAVTSKSKFSTQIFNGTLMAPVARYTARPSDLRVAYEYSAKLCYWYGCRNLVEYSNVRILDWYHMNGFSAMLKERPAIAYANVINSQVQNKYGVDPNTRSTWMTNLRSYVSEHYSKINDLELVQLLMGFRDADDKIDEVISLALAYLHYLDEAEFEEEAETPDKKREFFHFTLTNGMLTQQQFTEN